MAAVIDERGGALAGVETEPSVSGVSWPAVAAGAVANMALSLLVLSLGVGLGLAVVSPWGAPNVSTGFKIGTGLYFIVVAMIGSSVGGYLAGRLRTKWTGVHTDEVYFRDTAHGFLSWAFAALLGVILLAGPSAALLGQKAASDTGADAYVRALLQSTSPPQNLDAYDQVRAEMAGPLSASLARGGEMTAPDRALLQNMTQLAAGLSPADADKRVNDVATRIKADLDKLRSASAQLALWLTAAMFIGAFCASLAATEGGGTRDGTWGRRIER